MRVGVGEDKCSALCRELIDGRRQDYSQDDLNMK